MLPELPPCIEACCWPAIATSSLALDEEDIEDNDEDDALPSTLPVAFVSAAAPPLLPLLLLLLLLA